MSNTKTVPATAATTRFFALQWAGNRPDVLELLSRMKELNYTEEHVRRVLAYVNAGIHQLEANDSRAGYVPPCRAGIFGLCVPGIVTCCTCQRPHSSNTCCEHDEPVVPR